jgi:hypothetical protein
MVLLERHRTIESEHAAIGEEEFLFAETGRCAAGALKEGAIPTTLQNHSGENLPSGPAPADGKTPSQPGEENLDFKSEKDQRPDLEFAIENEILSRNPVVLVVEPCEESEKTDVF